MLYSNHPRGFVFTIAVSFFLFFVPPPPSYSQSDPKETDMVLVLKGNTRLQSGKAAEGVDLELKKDGKTVTKMMSGKNGKYSLQIEASIINKKNEYILYISQPGTIPKSISINTYITPEEYSAYTFPRYVFTLEIKMIETTIKDIVVERPSGRIVWDYEQHAFAFDQTYAKIIQMEDPDKKLKDAAAQKKKEEEALALAKKKADEDARLKAKADSADKRAKDDAKRIFDENLAAMKEEMMRKNRQDSLDRLATAAKGNAVVQIVKLVKPISPDDVDQNAFDGTGAYSINIAKKSLRVNQLKMIKKKAANLSAKYETNNTLTSLLNMVDEYDKNEKSTRLQNGQETKSQKQ